MLEPISETFSGRSFTHYEIDQILEIVMTCSGLSRTELANTVCELFSWKRPNGKLKTVECRQFLEYLDSKNIICLPQRRFKRPLKNHKDKYPQDKCPGRYLQQSEGTLPCFLNPHHF